MIKIQLFENDWLLITFEDGEIYMTNKFKNIKVLVSQDFEIGFILNVVV